MALPMDPVRINLRRLRPATAWTLAAVLGSAALYACDDLLVNPAQHPHPASASSLAVRLQMGAAVQSAGARGAFDKANRLRVRVTRGAEAVADTTVALAPAGEDTRLSLEIAPKGDADSVAVAVTLLRDAAELFRGTARAGLHAAQVVPVEVAIAPVAAGISVPDSVGPLASIGDTARLTGMLLFATGDSIGGEGLAWTSLDPAIADVAAGPSAVARANGVARLVAAAGDLRDTTLVRVRQQVRALRVTAPLDTLLVGDTVTYAAAPVDARGNPVADAPVTWTSTNGGVLDVTPAGLVTARGAGAGSVLALAGGFTAEVKVTVKPGAAQPVGPAGGVVATAGDTVRLVIPAGALAAPVRIAITPQAAYPAPERTVGGSVHHFAPDGTRFSVPAALTIRYDPARLPAGYPAGELRLQRIAGAAWEEVPGSTVDSVARVARGAIGGFSAYGIVARVPVAAISIAPDSATVLPGGTVQLTATLRDGGGVVLADRAVAWSSSDTTHAVVSASGLATGVREGTAVITASSGSASAAKLVTVLPTPAAGVVVAPDTATIYAGGAVQLAATVRDAGGAPLAGRQPVWATLDSAVAKVSPAGLVTGTGAGTATIRATSGAASGDARVTVLAAPAFSRLVVSPDSATLTAVDDTVRFRADGYDQYGRPAAPPSLAWSTPDTAVVTVDAGTGVARARANGSARIVGTAGTAADTSLVRVVQSPAAIDVRPDSAAIHDPGEPVAAASSVTDRNHQPIPGARPPWSSSAPGVAAVDSAGAIRGVADGTAWIRAALPGASGDSVAVRVQMVARVAVDSVVHTVAGDSGRLAPAALAANSDTIRGRVFTFSSSDTSVARVDPVTGVGRSVGPGTAYLTSAQGTVGIHGTTRVEVLAAGAVAAVKVTPDTAYVPLHGTVQLTAVFIDSAGRTVTGQEPTWKSGDTLVAAVSATGLVTGVAGGDVHVSAFAPTGVEGLSLVRVVAPVASVQVTPDSATVAVGGFVTLGVTVRDSSGNPVSRPVAWSSTDSAVASVDAFGDVTGVAPGTAVVQATSEGSSGSAVVTVVPSTGPASPVVTRIVASPDSLVMRSLYEYASLTYTAYDSAGNPVAAGSGEWSTPDTAVVSVDSGGQVIARAVGTARVIVRYSATDRPPPPPVGDARPAGPRLGVIATGPAAAPEDTVLVRVYQEPASVAALPTGTVLLHDPGEPVTATAAVYDANQFFIPGLRVTWSAANPSIATVDTAGHILAVGDGYTYVSATYGALPPTTVSIQVQLVASVSLSFTTLSATVGDTARLVPTAKDGYGNAIAERRFTFASSDPAVATVDSLGTIRAVAPGTARIDAKQGTRGIGASATVTVSAVPVPFVLSHVSAGYAHACALQPDRSAWCWGGNFRGALGNGGTAGSNYPAPVQGGMRFTRISAGYQHTCGLAYDSTGTTSDAYCWGDNSNGAAGTGAPGADVTAPAKVAGNRFWTSVVGGYNTTCGIEQGGAGYCWGVNSGGSAGLPVGTSQFAPVTPISGGHAWAELALGNGFTCGLDTAQKAWCWGSNNFGVFGDTVPSFSDVPVAVAGGHAFVHLATGLGHVCGIDTAFQTWCWGINTNGELGVGDVAAHNGPVKVQTTESFHAITAGGYHTCGVSAAGAMVCWGRNSNGELGTGGSQAAAPPAPVQGGTSVVEVAGGWYFECFATARGQGWCAGINQFGNLGQGTADVQTHFTPGLVLQQPAAPAGNRSAAERPVLSF
ncbi:MAG: Ig domain protein group 2 domain protein [Gemmatimonadetes bacterium]|nr:Ig domain protein group 2 domain protein [Gemmatimonadota bacterium]